MTAGRCRTGPESPTSGCTALPFPLWTRRVLASRSDISRLLRATGGVFDPSRAPEGSVPDVEWASGPGRFVVGVREDATRDRIDGSPIAAACMEVLAIGLSERTTPSGVEALASRLFAAGVVDRILAVDLPKVRAAMHLDTIMTRVDVDTFLTYPKMCRSLRSFQLTPRGDGGMHVEDAPGFVPGARVGCRGRAGARDRTGPRLDPRGT